MEKGLEGGGGQATVSYIVFTEPNVGSKYHIACFT